MAPNLDVKQYVWSILQKLSSLFDGVTNSIKTIDYPHHEIHEGDHFFYTDSVELASAATQDYQIYAPHSLKHAHLFLSLDGSAITQYQLYEGGDRVGTTLQTAFNNNRNSSETPGVTIHKGTGGGSADGTLIRTYKGGAATQQARFNSVLRVDDEIILKENTKYLLRVTSGTNNNLTNVNFSWYEHTSDE